jgi:eukaryotic-like serine/threonine-protein kinase
MVTEDALKKAPDDPMLGSEVGGRYGIISRLGMGGMGAVYKAVDFNRNLTVAIKVLRQAYAQHPAIRERFIREAEAGASLDHPNVVPLIDFGVEQGGRLWLAMEYVKGWTLRDEINYNGAFNVISAVELCKQVLKGLAVAHEAGLIHRDLKHDNIMYYGRRKKFMARIVDFGVVKSEAADQMPRGASALGKAHDLKEALKAAEEHIDHVEGYQEKGLGEQVLTAAGMMVGSPSYMSPEQIRGLKVGPPADLYALAVVVYEVLVARRLFSVNDYETLLKEGAKRDAPRLVFTAQGELIPEIFADIIHRALAHDPNERYPDAQTMLLALEQMKFNDSNLPADLFSTLPSSFVREKSQLGLKYELDYDNEDTNINEANEVKTSIPETPTINLDSAAQISFKALPLNHQNQIQNEESKHAVLDESSQQKIPLSKNLWLLPPLLFILSILCTYLSI